MLGRDFSTTAAPFDTAEWPGRSTTATPVRPRAGRIGPSSPARRPTPASAPWRWRAPAARARRAGAARPGLPAIARRSTGTAAALRVAHARSRCHALRHYDGLLSRPRAVRGVAGGSAPNVFSPSQLEIVHLLPVPVLLQYVLKLEPVDERDELDEDYTGAAAGSTTSWRRSNCCRPARRAGTTWPRSSRGAWSGRADDRGRGVDRGLPEIEKRAAGQTIERYVKQPGSTRRSTGTGGPSPHRFEVVFGQEDDERAASHPASRSAAGPGRAAPGEDRPDRLIATAERPGVPGDRLQDGHVPSTKDVKGRSLLQLPLYAMAVERLVLAGEGAGAPRRRLLGPARRRASRPIAFEEWAEDKDGLEAYVVEAGRAAPPGRFVVDSAEDDCTSALRLSRGLPDRPGPRLGQGRDDVPRLELKP